MGLEPRTSAQSWFIGSPPSQTPRKACYLTSWANSEIATRASKSFYILPNPLNIILITLESPSNVGRCTWILSISILPFFIGSRGNSRADSSRSLDSYEREYIGGAAVVSMKGSEPNSRRSSLSSAGVSDIYVDDQIISLSRRKVCSLQWSPKSDVWNWIFALRHFFAETKFKKYKFKRNKAMSITWIYIYVNNKSNCPWITRYWTRSRD